jgi:hypothetical protein
MGRRRERVNGQGYDRLGVIGIFAMLVHATGAPAFSAACSGGSSGSQWTPRNRRPVTFPAASETSQTSGGAITSGGSSWRDRSPIRDLFHKGVTRRTFSYDLNNEGLCHVMINADRVTSPPPPVNSP